MQVKDEDGRTYQEHLMSLLERARNKQNAPRIEELEAELELPVLPALAQHIWYWFYELSSLERSYSGMGDALPLSAGTIKAWAELYSVRFTKW